MRYSNLKLVITNQFAREGGNSVVYLIKGKPGGGKSALCRDIALTTLNAAGIEPEGNIVEFNASMRDPVDVLGTPNNRGDFTKWVPPEEFWALRAGRPGDANQEPCFLILEELTDAPVPMQNALCRVVYDKYAGNLKLSPYLRILASGNRTEDKSGATRLTTKLGNRTRQHTFDENIYDWVDWAQENDVDPVLIQFLRYKPEALSDFQPDRKDCINPTPRSWESVSRIDTSLPAALFFEEVAGSVGSGHATEYLTFRKVYESLVSVDEVVMNPKGVKVPKNLDALYATVGSCAYGTTMGNVDRIGEFMARLPRDFTTMYWMDAVKKEPKIKTARAYVQWCIDNENVVMAK